MIESVKASVELKAVRRLCNRKFLLNLNHFSLRRRMTSSSPTHADTNPIALQTSGKPTGGKLNANVMVLAQQTDGQQRILAIGVDL
jgi:hypothetical protein